MLFTGLAKHSSTFTGSETAANINSANAKTVTVKAKWKSNCTENCSDLDLSVNESVGFSYTGAVKGVTLKKAGNYKLEVWGAQGGSGKCTAPDQGEDCAIGGFGGYSYGTYIANNDSVIYVIVGQQGKRAAKGASSGSIYNGGGTTSITYRFGKSGGGATHISTYNCGELKNCSSRKSDIIIVAGGGGGGMDWCSSSEYQINGYSGLGGSGGGYQASTGVAYSNVSLNPTSSANIASHYGGGGGGGNQSTGGSVGGSYSGCGPSQGSFGLGGSATGYYGAGGGGGWYGGGGATPDGSGGGGSGYLNTSKLISGTYKMYGYTGVSGTNTTATTNTGYHQTNKANAGDGYARITYLGT